MQKLIERAYRSSYFVDYRADVIIETECDVFIFELKLDGSAKDALQQIEDKQYAVPYLSDKRKVHKIGVNISSASRTVEEWIVI